MTNRARIKLLFAVAVLITCASLAAFQAAQKAPDASSDPLIAGFQKTTVA